MKRVVMKKFILFCSTTDYSSSVPMRDDRPLTRLGLDRAVVLKSRCECSDDKFL